MKYLDKLVSWFRSLFDEVDSPSSQEKEVCNMLQEERNKVVKEASTPKRKSGKTISQRKAIANRKKTTPKTK